MEMNIKEWSWLKKTSVILGIVSACGFSFYGMAEAAIAFKLDQRYLQSSEIEIKKNLDPRYITIAGYAAIKKNERISNLQEKIFTLEFKVQQDKASPLDKALLQRYKTELYILLNIPKG